MTKLAIAAIAGLLAATAPLPAHADGPGYIGGCHVVAVNDPTPGGTLGGGNTWNAVVGVAVVATAPADGITASCWIKVNGGTEIKVLDATGPGTGFTAGAGRTSFTASVDDTVELCTHVTTGSAGSSDICAALTVTPVCPPQVCDAGGLVDQATPLLCGVLITVAPVVDSLPTSGVLYVDPATGDTYAGGTTASDRAWDCPSYAEGSVPAGAYVMHG